MPQVSLVGNVLTLVLMISPSVRAMRVSGGDEHGRESVTLFLVPAEAEEADAQDTERFNLINDDQITGLQLVVLYKTMARTL